MTSRRSQRTAFYNACGSIDWTNELNHGLSSWHIVLPSTDTGPVWHDLCGNYHGTLTNLDVLAAWPGSTRSGSWGAMLTDGVDGYVSLAGGGGLNNVQSGTISMWVRWIGTQDTGANTNAGAVLGRQGGASFSNHIISLNGTDPATAKILWRPYISNVAACTSATSPGNGVWRHILVTYASGSHRLYLDGQQDATGTTTGTMTNDSAQPLTVGSWLGFGNNSFSTAHIDCVRIFPNRIFTAEEAYEEYQRTQYYADGLLMKRRGWVRAVSSQNKLLLRMQTEGLFVGRSAL